MSPTARAIGSVAGRTLWAGAALALVAGVVVAADRYPLPAVQPATSESVPVPPVAAVLVCPGPLRLATEQEGSDAEYDPAFDPTPVGATSELGVVTARRAEEAPAVAIGGPLAGGGTVLEVAPTVEAGSARLDGVATGLALRAEATGDAPAWLAGALAWRTTAGDLRGLAAASCQRPAARSWLVGGSTALGSSARLVLQNPGATPATVTLQMWGATGPLDLAGTPEYLVGPGEEEVVLLEGIAAEQPHMALQILAQGGLVTAYLQDSRTDGLVPAGVDLVVPGAPPATTQVVPGIAVGAPGDAVAGDAVASDEPVPEPSALLRVVAPGDADGTVEVVLLGAEGVVRLPGTERLEVAAGEVLDVPLGGLPAGDYTAVVTADVPVVAGAAVTRVGTPAEPGDDPPVERAWSPSVAPGHSGPLALPGDAPGRLVLAAVPAGDATGPAVATVVALDAAGAVLGSREVAVAADAAVVLPLTELTGNDAARPAGIVVRTDDDRLAWAVVLEGEAEVAVVAPVPQQVAQPEVPVVLR